VLGSGPPSADAIRSRADSLARASAIALVVGDAAAARTFDEEAEQIARVGMIESAEAPLATARVLRSEARRSRAAEALALAEKRAGTSPVLALCLVERGEARESEGDLPGAAAAFQKALSLADAAREFARWHGEIDLRARVEARLAGVLLGQKDFAGAQGLLITALGGWRKTGWAWGESRVLANLGTLKAQSNDFVEASKWFAEAVAAGERTGDLLFQARALLNLARSERRISKGSEKQTAERARTVATKIGWEDGRKQAESLLTG
jgi:tetratricopeptide (TPR) repeat protein